MPRLTRFKLHFLPYTSGLKGKRGVLSLQNEQTNKHFTDDVIVVIRSRSIVSEHLCFKFFVTKTI
jgi:hypothetical protein